MDPSAQLQQPFSNRSRISDSIFLLSFNALARDALLELASEIFFEFARRYHWGSRPNYQCRKALSSDGPVPRLHRSPNVTNVRRTPDDRAARECSLDT